MKKYAINETTYYHTIHYRQKYELRCLPRADLHQNSKFVYIIIDLAKEAKTYKDLTKRFPHQSSRGNNYIFVAYNYDNNEILVEAMPNRETNTIIKVWNKCDERLIKHGIATTRYMLNNECSMIFCDALNWKM